MRALRASTNAVLLLLATFSAAVAQVDEPSGGSDPPVSEAEPPASSALEVLEAALERPSQSGPVLGTHRLRGVRPEVVGALFAPDIPSDFPIEVLAPPVSGSESGGPSGVALFIEIDGADFLARNQADIARVEVYAYALGDGGRVAAHLAEMFTVDIGALGESVWQSGLKFHGGLALAPGRYELIVMVRNYQSGAGSRRRVAVVVPGPETAASIVGFGAPASRDGWVPVESAGYSEFWPLDRARANGAPASPAARAVLVAGREAEGFLMPASPASPASEKRLDSGRSGRLGRVEFQSETENEPEDEPLATVEARIQASGPEAPPRLLFEVPELQPGRYRLRLAPVGAEVSSQAESAHFGPSAWVPVALVGEDTRERELLWSDLRWMLQQRPGAFPGEDGGVAGETAPRSVAPERRRGGRATRRLAARYRAALAELGSADPRRASSALFELESEVLGQGDRKAQLNLRTAETSVAREVAERDPEALLPLLLLHSELVEQYRGRKIFSLVTHSRIMVEIIAELLVETGGSSELAASVLAIQGRYLQQSNLVAGSRRLLIRALEHDPQSAAALLGLAASFEKYADYNRAIELLVPLVAQRPDLDEAALRLAINQARVGWLPRAREGLEKLLAKERRDWVSALAAEELARSYLIGADLPRAVAILEPSIQSMPRWPGLRVLLAHVYDRQGRVGSALELLAEVEVDPGTGASARRRYDEWPRQLVAGALEELERAARAATPVLLASLPAGEDA